MRTVLHERAGHRLVEGVEPVAAKNDAHALVAACIEHGASNLLLDAPALSPAFFDLRTGIAGELLQKLQNYRVRLALVVADEHAHGERVTEWLREAKRGRSFRAFTTRAGAEAWLAGE